MITEKKQKTIRHFAKHLFLVGNIYVERNKAREDLDQFMERLRDSIIRMRFSYTDVERLKKKIDNLLKLERKFGKFYRGEESDIEFRLKIADLEDQVAKEREEKIKIREEHEEKVKELKSSFENIKENVKYLLLEKAKRHNRMKELEKKIGARVVKR